MSDFLDTAVAIGTGLWWLWAFIGCLVVACLLISGGIGALAVLDDVLERWHHERGHIRAVDDKGRDQWVPAHPKARAAQQLDEIRTLPEVRRG